MIDYATFHKVVIHESFIPGEDRDQFLAYMILCQKYPNLTYQSHDGYTCHALVDYSKDICWDGKKIFKWSTKETIRETMKDFCDYSMIEIIDIWIEVMNARECN